MSFRFRRSVKLFPGVRINLGKRGASVSIGGRGAHITVGHTGTRTTVGLPGSGLSYTHLEPQHRAQRDESGDELVTEPKAGGSRGWWWAVLALVIVLFCYAKVAP